MKKNHIVIILIFYLELINGSTFLNVEFADNAMCGADMPALKKYLRYSSLSGPLVDPVRIENGELKPSYPTAITDAYNYEGSRRNGSKCLFCPYHQYPDEFAPEWFLLGNIRFLPTPMYGPCFNGQKSAKINCVQNLLFFPPEFAGEYFYPDQRGNLAVSQGELFPIHIFLTGTSNLLDDGSPKLPTNYGLGKTRVLDNIATLTVKYVVSGDIDYNTTSKLQEPFLNDKDGNERWLFWAQYYCTPGCHKNSQQRYVTVRPEDYLNKSQTLYYLSRKTSAVDGALSMYQCKECPDYHASYMWYFDSGNNYEFPGLAKRNPFASQCYPWFGSIPALILSAQDPAFNTTLTRHSIATDGVQIPTQTTNIVSQPCQSGTFNDICAHTIKYYALSSSPSLAQCRPCAAGYHTDGKVGSWYCLPPLGMMMSNWALLMSISNSKNQSLIWSRRDILGYEFECGYLSSHCTQCSAATNTLGLLPDAFNREMILKPLLAVVLCPSTYFCPSSIQAPVKCPETFPWSPAGSWSILNCTCSRGTYLLAGNCVACNSNIACPAGSYMAGWRMCVQRDGATNGGICTPCANKPFNANYSMGAGIEVGPLSAYFGVCPFNCPNGHIMNTVVDMNSYCLNTYSCTPVAQLNNIEGVAVYSNSLTFKQDEFTAKMSETGAFICADNKLFTIETYNAKTSSNWPRISTNCLEANPSQCATTACNVLEDASYDHNVRCIPCPAAPINGSYSSAANSGYTSLALRSSICSIQCDSGLYINMTSYTCMSCLALDAAVCPAEYKMRGQGCLGIYDTFSASNLSSNCIRCSISLADVGSGFYMDLQGINGCEKKTCPVVYLGGSKYKKEVCGGFSIGRVEDCTGLSECGPSQFLSGSCTEFSTGICKNCTDYNPGYYIPPSGSCSHIATDTLWMLCGVNMGSGFYCPGHGGSVICPNGKTSMPGAKSVSDCYCAAGTKNNGEGGCYNFVCPDSQASFLAPGVGYTTKSYMALDSAMVTACYPCSSLVGNSFSFTVGGVGFDSCTCPTEMYGLVVEGGNLSCINCPLTQTTCSGGSGYNIPSTCWRGTSMGGPTVCQCALPPFTMKTPIGCQVQQCIANFDPLDTFNTGASIVPLKEISSGSSIYIDRTTSLGGWSPRYFAPQSSTYDYTIAKMTVTSDNSESSSEINLQYVLWTIKDQDNQNIIWTAPLPPMERDTLYDPYSRNPSPWKFECETSESKALEDMAVSKWPYTYSAAQYNDKNIVPPIALVGAVVKQGELRFLYLKELTINLNTQDVLWGPETNNCGIGTRQAISFEVPANSTVISTTHAYAFPSLPLSVSSSAFYMGYNAAASGSCGIVAVRLNGLLLHERLILDLTSASKRQITAMAVLAAQSGGVWLYLAFHNVPDSLKLVKWSGIAGGTVVESDEIFKGGWPLVVSISVIWPKDSILPIFMALAKNDTTGKTAVITADGMQRTFTEVQGMPASTSPSIVRGLEVGLNKGLIVGTGGSTIFSIAMQRCPQVSVNSRIVPRFWDGESCIAHTCMRPRTCAIEGVGQVYDNIEMRCTCSPGYYKTSVGFAALTCVQCSSNSYCANNTIFTCPTSMISSIGSKLAVDCTCQEGYYFTGTACLQCPNGKWCPNKWHAFSCLGGFDTVPTQVGSIYPTLCTCSVGFIGPKCDPCSNGKYCSKGAILVSPVTNVPIRLTVTLHASIFSTFSMETIEETACEVVKQSLFQLFSSSGIWYLRQLDTLERRFLCKYIPPSPRTKSMLIIVLQVESGDSSSLSYMVNLLTYNTSLVRSMMDVNLVEPFQIATYTVINNTENICPVGKVPTEDRGSCYCAPGYRSSYQLCIGCLSGSYKQNAGPGECIQCPSGTTSKSLSSICYSTSSTPANSTNLDGSDSDSNLPIIIGGVVGGVVLVALLIFGLVKALYPS